MHRRVCLKVLFPKCGEIIIPVANRRGMESVVGEYLNNTI